MTEHTVLHSTFSLERSYPHPRDRVFAAWAEPAARATWFADKSEHELDFRVGGRELTTHRPGGDKPTMTFESRFHDIVVNERIICASTLAANCELMTSSLTTVQFSDEPGGTRLVLTEQDAFLDGQEQPQWREQGTQDQLDALLSYLRT